MMYIYIMDIKLFREIVRGSPHAFDIIKDGIEYISSIQQMHHEFNGDNCEDTLNMSEDPHDVISH